MECQRPGAVLPAFDIFTKGSMIIEIAPEVVFLNEQIPKGYIANLLPNLPFPKVNSWKRMIQT